LEVVMSLSTAAAPTTPPIAPKPRKVDTTYDRLRELIATLALDPGSPIEERVLLARLGVGRTPLREAIQRLAYEGLIVEQPRRGRWVSPLSVMTLGQLIESRRVVEPAVARLAALRITPDHLARLEAFLDQAEPLVDQGENTIAVTLDQQFHFAIAAASGNQHLMRMVEQILHSLVRYWYVSFMRIERLAPIFAHHRVLLAAVASHDPDRAEQEALVHIDLFRERMRDLASGMTEVTVRCGKMQSTDAGSLSEDRVSHQQVARYSNQVS